LLFVDFAKYCENIASHSKKSEKIDILAQCIAACLQEEVSIVVRWFTVPENCYQVSEKLLKTWISDLCEITLEKMSSFMQLWADCGSVFFHEWKGDLSNLSLSEVSIILQQIADIKGEGSLGKKEQLFSSSLRKFSPLEGMYFIRILQGTLRIGVFDKMIIEAIAKLCIQEKDIKKRIEEWYSTSANLPHIAFEVIAKGRIAIPGESTVIFSKPVQPQKADRIINNHIPEMKKYIVQGKYDGLRVQFHVNEYKVYAFSRNLQSITGMFPEVEDALQSLIGKMGGGEFIFDGEIVAWDVKKNRMLSFQKTAERRRKYHKDDQNFVRYCIFDMLLENGRSLLKDLYSDRIASLENLFVNVESDFVSFVESHKVDDRLEIKKLFDLYCERGFEGIIIKDGDSFYEAGKRSKNWVKWKKNLSLTFNDSIDAVVVGIYFRKGIRANKRKIGSLLLALYDEKSELFLPFVKVGTGLNEGEWRSIWGRIESKLFSQKPDNIGDAKMHPDKWCQPEVVVAISGDSFSVSPTYLGGFSIRFPRLIRSVSDKNPYDCTFLEEINR